VHQELGPERQVLIDLRIMLTTSGILTGGSYHQLLACVHIIYKWLNIQLDMGQAQLSNTR